MSENVQSRVGRGTSPEDVFGKTLMVAAGLPGVRVDRTAYLRSALRASCSDEEIDRAVTLNPPAAGISIDVLDRAAKSSIGFETTKATAISTAAGIPGGFAMLGTIPADTAQYFAHMIRISQKLAYLYGWPDLFDNNAEELDDATKNVLILFLGVMLGANAATGAVSKLSAMMATQVAKKLPAQALTKGLIYPIVKKVATQLGVKMTKSLFANGVAKAIPVVGGVVSGGLTLATSYQCPTG